MTEPKNGAPGATRIASFLRELLSEGGHVTIWEPPQAWLAPYLDDRAPTDTFNAAIDAGYVESGYDTSSDIGTITLLDSGRQIAEAAGGPSTRPLMRPVDETSVAYGRGYAQGDAHDKVPDPDWRYDRTEKADYMAGFRAGRDAWIAGKTSRGS